VLTLPDGSEAEIVKAGAVMASERETDLLCKGLPASATVTVKLEIPVPVGVPEIRPVLLASESPAGRPPLVIDHVKGDVPPLACREVEYDVPFVPEDKEDVVIATGRGAMLSERVTDLVCAGLDESVTVKVGLVVLLAVGVPERIPVAGARLRPLGRALLDQL